MQSTEAMGIDTSPEQVKNLESERIKLRIANAYLKELRRLRLEEEAPSFYWQGRLRKETFFTTVKTSVSPIGKEMQSSSAPVATDFVEIKMTDQTGDFSDSFKLDVIIRRGSVADSGGAYGR